MDKSSQVAPASTAPRPDAAHFDDAAECAREVVNRVGNRLVVGLALGLGKANQFANALFARACEDSELSLEILTALTLEKPRASSDLERRFLEPFVERLYGECPELDYALARRRGLLPANVRVAEFFMQPGSMLGNTYAQQNYLSTNYTHASRDLLDRGVNVIAQMVAPHPTDPNRFSLSSNPDVLLDVLASSDEQRRNDLILVAEINPALPFMPNDAEVDRGLFDLILETPRSDAALFSAPLTACTFTDYAIAAHVTSLVKDGGTLQIGIGSLGDAISHLIRLRHEANATYGALMADLLPDAAMDTRIEVPLETATFSKGLYAASEMVAEGFSHLHRAGVLKRRVYDDEHLQALINEGAIDIEVSVNTLRKLLDCGRIHSPLTEDDTTFLQHFGILEENVRWQKGMLLTRSGAMLSPDIIDSTALATLCKEALGTHLKGGIYMHGGFFLGSRVFYQWLRDLSDADRAGINMTGIRFINELYGRQQLKTLQRTNARFVNSAMMVTLTGAVVSDGLADNRVVSGVGGQYNFVALGHELPGARSVICVPSTRRSGGQLASNIVWQYPHTTIPRHLRDIVVTEYGAADLRGRTDSEVVAAMLSITDSRFQQELLDEAQQAGKIDAGYAIAEVHRNNFPQHIDAAFECDERLRQFPHYPLGTDFTAEEATLAIALRRLKEAGGQWRVLAKLLRSGWRLRQRGDFAPLIARLELDRAKNMKDRLYRVLVLGALGASIDARRPMLPDRNKPEKC